MNITFQTFDFLSPNIYLYYKGKHKHSSVYSGILSIISISLITIFSFIFLEDLQKKNPSAFYYNRYVDNISAISFNSSGLFHLLNLTPDASEYEVNRLFSIIGINNYMFLIVFNNIEDFDHYIYDYCGINDIKGIDNLILENTYDFNSLFCIKRFYNKTTQRVYNLNNKEFPYPEIIYGASHPHASVYGIVVEKCKNSSIINNNHCYSSEIIDKAMKSLIGYSIDFLDHNIIIDDYENPNFNIYHSIKNLYSFGSGYTTNHLNFVPTTLKTNKGFFFNDEEILHSYKFSFNEKLTTLFEEEENSNKGIYAAFYFWIQNQEDIFVRSYKKIQDILGSIIGIGRIIFLFSKAINILIHKYIYINDINYDMKNDYKKFIDKSISTNSSPILKNIIKLKNNFIKSNNDYFNNDKSNIGLNNKNINSNNKIKIIDNNNQNFISFFIILKNIVFRKKELFISRLIKLRKYVLSEEIMYKYYFIINSFKLSENNITKDLDLKKNMNELSLNIK